MGERERVVMTEVERAFVLEQRVAILAMSDAQGGPTSTPVCFAYDGERFFTPLDEKPKQVEARALGRVRAIEERPEVSLLAQRYDDDWSRLGYVQAQGVARLLEPGEAGHARAVALLRERYPQYVAMRLEELPVIAVTPVRIRSWGPAVEGGESATGRSAWMLPGRGVDFLPLARGRRSVRAFTERPAPREALLRMLEAAQWGPSPHGRQPWRFVVLTTAEAKARLAEAMGEEWQRTLAMDAQPEQVIAARLERSHERIRTAPALVLVCLYLEDVDRYPDAERQRAEETMAVQSLGAAVENMLLEAYAQGLDAGWMCAPLFCQEAVRAALGLEATLAPHALVAVGYAARDPKRRPRRGLEELVTWFE